VDPPESADAAPVRTGDRLTGSEAVKLHVTLATGLALCAAAFAFELARALGGNPLSWAYVFEWPLFAAFAVYLWWNTLHQRRPGPRPDRRPTVAPEHVQMLKAWQEHQRQMAATEAEHRSRPAGTEPRSGR